MNHEKLSYFTALDIQPWQLKNKISTNPCSQASYTDWDEANSAINNCLSAGLHQHCTRLLFTAGDPHADLILIMETPADTDNQLSKPLTAATDSLLKAMLSAIDISYQSVYVANFLHCKTLGDEALLTDKSPINALKNHIDQSKPKLLIAWGESIAQSLIDSGSPITELRGTTHTFADTPLIVTYSLDHLLRHPADKRKAFQDLQLVLTVTKPQHQISSLIA
jgi:uracil-DNA glycosylase family 4